MNFRHFVWMLKAGAFCLWPFAVFLLAFVFIFGVICVWFYIPGIEITRNEDGTLKILY